LTIHIRIAAPWRLRLGRAVLAAALFATPAAFAQSSGGQSAGSQSAGSQSAGSQSGGKEYTVTMGNMDYGALPSGLTVGDTIVWVNHDTVIHSVTARDHSFDIRINPGQTARMPLATAGKFPFYCLFHPNMRGVLTVGAK
jgi:plastocyanin